MPTVLLTGFPGFLGSALLPRLLESRDADRTITCLVQPHYRPLAEARAAEIARVQPGWAGRLHLCEGDITRPELGLRTAQVLQREIEEIYHLAALYDLGAPSARAERINVDGTRHLLHFAEACPRLRRFQYVSSCYVSGRYAGSFTEDDLDVGQTFNNYYEETKYRAEEAVQQQRQDGLPTTIYRPAIVVGDSATGATQKYDGPYYMMQWMLRWPGCVPMVVPPHPERYRINVVPRDFVVDAMAYLGALDVSEGRVYQLADPSPPSLRHMLDLLSRATGRRVLSLSLSARRVERLLAHAPRLQQWTGIAPEVFAYLAPPARYTTYNTLRDLQGSGIACPPFAAYVNRLVAFMRQQPNLSPAAMA